MNKTYNSINIKCVVCLFSPIVHVLTCLRHVVLISLKMAIRTRGVRQTIKAFEVSYNPYIDLYTVLPYTTDKQSGSKTPHILQES